MLFNIECLQYTESVVVGGKSVYHQTFNPDSAMRKFNLESNFCGIRSLELQKRLWIKQNLIKRQVVHQLIQSMDTEFWLWSLRFWESVHCLKAGYQKKMKIDEKTKIYINLHK